MKRHSFLQMAGMGLMTLPSLAATASNKNRKIKVPAYLQPGDTIGITCPAGFSLLETIQPSIDLIQSWGYKIQVGTTIGKMDHTFGGTDVERAQDFQQMMDDPDIKAILCATGGYGAVRMVDLLNFNSFKQSPKWVIGFSDITVLHSHLHQVVHVASLHSKMCGSFPKEWATADEVQQASILSIKDALEGKKISYPSIPIEHNRIGSAKGLLVGGNLKILENLNGSASMINTDRKILFLEDVGEPLYNIDRMFCNLLRSGKLAKLSGLIVGGFSNIKVDNPAVPFGRDIYTIVKEKVAAFNYPVCFDFPVGHIKNNFALKCGLPHELIVENSLVQLTEI
ncbi:MAG TPA: LD-carboxypeptidase [Sediminibacterium sp.]|uniref:S66 peptidase family protein n=1 Tax=Sediminibacterium sp. TaxID=1917865 RepID=UPI0008BF7A48|nr:LD-carboxypeptidase [Sediminibacterium sp.]OHC86902.1 MAG: LD-carboxypeptidase [Sphingobacteriia bacterium RIFOXYC2_FULL_35_18]OHC88241.1 MAG: LD-carboxypeptidase [Sphingobacteriia bacterium RIFOXYD2_FULL_35_12]HLD51712.1 LD-carboxypeptidase [Sediminibacterium sp.]